MSQRHHTLPGEQRGFLLCSQPLGKVQFTCVCVWKQGRKTGIDDFCVLFTLQRKKTDILNHNCYKDVLAMSPKEKRSLYFIKGCSTSAVYSPSTEHRATTMTMSSTVCLQGHNYSHWVRWLIHFKAAQWQQLSISIIKHFKVSLQTSRIPCFMDPRGGLSLCILVMQLMLFY